MYLRVGMREYVEDTGVCRGSTRLDTQKDPDAPGGLQDPLAKWGSPGTIGMPELRPADVPVKHVALSWPGAGHRVPGPSEGSHAIAAVPEKSVR